MLLGFNQNDVFNSSSISGFEFDDGTARWRTRAAIINSEAANDANYGNSFERRAA